MMARPSVSAFTEWVTPGGMIATKPGRAILCHAVDCHLKFTVDDLVNFFPGVRMLVNGRALDEFIMGESHT